MNSLSLLLRRYMKFISKDQKEIDCTEDKLSQGLENHSLPFELLWSVLCRNKLYPSFKNTRPFVHPAKNKENSVWYPSASHFAAHGMGDDFTRIGTLLLVIPGGTVLHPESEDSALNMLKWEMTLVSKLTTNFQSVSNFFFPWNIHSVENKWRGKKLSKQIWKPRPRHTVMGVPSALSTQGKQALAGLSRTEP